MRGTRAVTDVQRLAAAADDFHLLENRWPLLAELRALDGALPERDPWRRAFVFDLAADGSCVVRSAGVDGRIGTADDVTSWAVDGTGQWGAAASRRPATSR